MKPKLMSRLPKSKHRENPVSFLHRSKISKKHLLKSPGKNYLKLKKKQLKERRDSIPSPLEESKEYVSDSDVQADLSPNCSPLSSNDEVSTKNSWSDPSIFQSKSLPEHLTSAAYMNWLKVSEERPQDPIVSSDDSQSESDSGEIQEIRNFWLFESDSSDTSILVLRHPCQVVLSGCMQVRALSGSAEIHGWELSPDTTDSAEYTHVFSSSHYGRHVLCTMDTERLPKRVNIVQHLTARLSSVSAESFLPNVLSVASLDCVVVAVTRMDTGWSVEYASSVLCPSVFLPQQDAYHSNGLNFSVSQNFSGALLVTQEHRKMAQQIIRAIQYTRSIGAPAPCIVICGDRDTGKSTFIRYLINATLSSGVSSSVCHLDGDPGQAEFTPSCCVTLTCISSPLLGPPFTHQKTPVRQCFVGGPNVEDMPDLYSSCLSSLVDHYTEHFSSEPLFVNTMGWTRGVGLSLLVDVLRYCQPSLVIQMHSHFSHLSTLNSGFLVEECGWMSTRAQLNPNRMDTEFCRITAVQDKGDEAHSEIPQLGLAAPLQRQLSALAYLSRVLGHSADRQLTSVQPKCVPMEAVSVMLSSKVSVKQEDILQVINGSWIALCSVSSPQVSDTRNASTTAMKLMPNKCVGFGLVRGVDLDQNLILVLTPEPLSRLQEVNALAVMGDLLPIQVYTNQRSEGSVPYVSQTSGQSKSGLGVKIKQTRKRLD